MPRLARVNIAGEPYHIVQRGNRAQKVFFKEADKQSYLDILSLQSKLFGLDVWAYCLMDNHVHLIAVPLFEESLVKAVSEAHELYTRVINSWEGWRGNLWQGRFKSVVLDEQYLYSAVRYVERNPVREKIVKRAEDYKWSSAHFHSNREENTVLCDFYLLNEIEDWSQYLKDPGDEAERSLLREHSLTGRPLGSISYLKKLEKRTGRILIRQKPGPKKPRDK